MGSVLLVLPASENRLVDPEANETHADDEDDAEDKDNASVLSGPVAALGDVGEGVAGDNGEIEGGHFAIAIKTKDSKVGGEEIRARWESN